MSFLDHLRQKWKHSDPTVREQAVRELEDQELLEKIALDDESENVRLAAVERLTDQDALARLARGSDPLAVAAVKRLTDRSHLAGVAQFAESRDVREIAVGHITERPVLHRIATSDTDPKVRWLARSKSIGLDDTRDVIRSELSKLQLAQRKLDGVTEFCGTLDDVCSALVRDGRFRINGAVERNELGLATIRELTPPPAATAPAASVDASLTAPLPAMRFLAAKRETAGRTEDAAAADAFFEINVWRTDENTFHCQTQEKRLNVVQNSVMWSRVSNGATGGAVNRGTTPVDRNSRPA